MENTITVSRLLFLFLCYYVAAGAISLGIIGPERRKEMMEQEVYIILRAAAFVGILCWIASI